MCVEIQQFWVDPPQRGNVGLPAAERRHRLAGHATGGSSHGYLTPRRATDRGEDLAHTWLVTGQPDRLAEEPVGIGKGRRGERTDVAEGDELDDTSAGIVCTSGSVPFRP